MKKCVLSNCFFFLPRFHGVRRPSPVPIICSSGPFRRQVYRPLGPRPEYTPPRTRTAKMGAPSEAEPPRRMNRPGLESSQ
jgi:hypothetical protein